jgi:hypothetical protein
MLKTSQGLRLEYSRMGVGGYEFIYFLVILIPVLLFIFFKDNFKIKKRYRALGIVIIFIFSVNVILANYSTALILLILGYYFIFFLNKIKQTRILFYLLLFILFYISFNFISIVTVDFLLDNLDENSRNFSRLLEIKDYLISGASGDSINARNSAFKKSIDVFFENPMLGIALEPLETNSSGQVTGFGQHSQILDTFALYGIIIGVIQIWLYSYPIYSRLIAVKGYINGLSLSILIIFLILITINVATPSIGFAVFFIFPSVYEKYLENSSN